MVEGSEIVGSNESPETLPTTVKLWVWVFGYYTDSMKTIKALRERKTCVPRDFPA